ncbi:MAG: cyclase family protein [Ruminiclostridium sp.]
MKLIDLSHDIVYGMPIYPGDSEVILTQTKVYSRDQYNDHRLETGMHVGTHVDGPMHMTDVNSYICDLNLDSFIGQGCIIHAQNQNIIKLKDEYIDLVKGNSIVLIHTGTDCCYGEGKYYSEHPVLDMPFCEMLVKNNIKMVGLDMPSVDRFPFAIHKYLLSHEVLILENLTNLDKINDDDSFEVMAFPLKIKSDSCMVRAVARVL